MKKTIAKLALVVGLAAGVLPAVSAPAHADRLCVAGGYEGGEDGITIRGVRVCVPVV
jgi:hypothetical protein